MKIAFAFSLLCLILVCSCNKENSISTIRALPMDSSLAIIIESTSLLTKSCTPTCWPRDFSKKKVTKYVGYVLQNRPGQLIQGMHRHIRFGLDSSYYPLIDYASNNELQEIRAKDVSILSNQRVKIELTNGLHRNFNDDELGYIKVSPVTTNADLSRGVFFYELSGEFYSSWVVCIRRKQNRWVIVNKKRLAVS